MNTDNLKQEIVLFTNTTFSKAQLTCIATNKWVFFQMGIQVTFRNISREQSAQILKMIKSCFIGINAVYRRYTIFTVFLISNTL